MVPVEISVGNNSKFVKKFNRKSQHPNGRDTFWEAVMRGLKKVLLNYILYIKLYLMSVLNLPKIDGVLKGSK